MFLPVLLLTVHAQTYGFLAGLSLVACLEKSAVFVFEILKTAGSVGVCNKAIQVPVLV